MRRRVLADTGPLYALIDPDDGLHRRAVGELARISEEQRPVLAAVPTLMETYSLLVHRFGSHLASGWLAEVRSGTGLVHPSAPDFDGAADRVARSLDQRITLFDAVLAELSDRLRVSVWTFDHHFDVLGVVVWRAV